MAQAAGGPLITPYDGPAYTVGVPVNETIQLAWSWTIFDSDGVCSQYARQYTSSSGWSGWTSVPAGTKGTLKYVAGLRDYTQLEVLATDCRGNQSNAYGNGRQLTFVDDRTSSYYPYYSGVWKKVASSQNLLGTVTLSDQVGASAYYYSSNTSHFGLIMNKCSACGKVDVYIDGVKKRSLLSLYSSSTQHRVMVAQFGFQLGYHEIRVVHAGGGRVTLDGIHRDA